MNPKLTLGVIKKALPTILTGIAAGGVVLTGWLTHKAARKSDPEKSFKENWKNYIPCAAAGIGTIACVIGANCMHLHVETALAGAVAFYKAASDSMDKVGHETLTIDKETGELTSKDGYSNFKLKTTQNASSTVKIRIWEPYTKQWFEASQQEILWAELTANKLLHQSGRVTLNDVLRFYSDPNLKMKKIGDKLGWSWDDENFEESACYYYAGGWIDMCPQFDDSQGNYKFVMDYGINPTDLD